ncbi:hypothetical protein L486_00740 [Kwoniella mangroviensis CBS 10435]|uniref:Fe2OG dioxygenase domain-containing protein n=1 Tax=Kwoniella mangroviensis CBS 10435 TaxID=1331196 RepID=A0A1B9IZY9_9TREE|nr:uncharacterized protein I203_04272 [Kwoniella mangroviensis CBS 8507]OCF61096.1 hypothetical protein L486_00740 [Kwoniella mangroviensis CBS 10435]OCF66696.1 hypothetical protein I203_04272 [Kwoniella mangroviensis CBS 8507]OCF74156.1 hypothetical protein I204_04526 [Kwoniella mangroviensis CBS 8886]
MPDNLPIIDPLPYLPPSSLLQHLTPLSSSDLISSREATAKKIHAACRDIGFFYLKVDAYLTKEEMKEVLELGREFFHRPRDEKESIGLEKSDGVRGYQKLHQNITKGKVDHHEGLDLYAPSPYTKSTQDNDDPKLNGIGERKFKHLDGPNQWPSQPESFKPKLEQWIEKMKVLGWAVMHAMADGLGMTSEEWDELGGMVNDSFWVMRVIGYPPLPNGADGISCGEHKDYGCLTLLHADPIPSSLQVLSKSNQWINADPIEGCIIVNIGEMWEIWTGGMYPSTLHRVIHKSPTYRVSIPFFYEPNFNARVRLLGAAGRKAKEEGIEVEEKVEVVYGDFLLGKVSGNFKY